MHGAIAELESGYGLGLLENNLGYNLRVAQLRVFAAFSEVAAPLGVSPSQFAVLLLIAANPGIKQIDLADVLDVDRSTMGRIVDRCVEAKLVRRGSSKLDRRVAPPMLTARGRALIVKLEPVVARQETLACGLSPSERVALLGYLKRVSGRTR